MIVDTETGEEVRPDSHDAYRTPEYYAGLARDAAFSPDGTLIVTAHVDGTLRVWGIPQN